MPQIRTAIIDGPVDVAASIQAVMTPECGGIGVFVGTVRSSAAGPSDRGDVQALEYETHPTLAPQKLNEIASAAAARWDVRRVVALHSSGHCELGDPTVVIACAAPHRKDALEACRWMIDEIKHQVPIWKREVYRDGSAWVGAGS